MDSNTGVSRRRFMRTAAAAASAPVVAAAASVNATAGRQDVLVAATVVRASVSRSETPALRLGVRVSVLADGFSRENIVVSVDGVGFNSSAESTRNAITQAVRERVATELSAAGESVSPERIAVQVFGGVL